MKKNLDLVDALEKIYQKKYLSQILKKQKDVGFGKEL